MPHQRQAGRGLVVHVHAAKSPGNNGKNGQNSEEDSKSPEAKVPPPPRRIIGNKSGLSMRQQLYAVRYYKQKAAVSRTQPFCLTV